MKALGNGANIIVSLMLVGVAIGLAFVALPIFGNKALIVRSASMQPTIPVGGFIVVRPQENVLAPQPALIAPKYNVGDVIAFQDETNPKIITTHRIVNAEIKDGKIFYQTKGDANSTPDNNQVAEANVIGRSWLSVPFIGRLFAFTKSNIGFPLLVIFPALLVIILESINIFKEFRKQRKISQNQFPPRISVAGFKFLIPVAISVLVFQNSFAFFSDSEISTNNTFQADEMFPQTAPLYNSNSYTCSGGASEASGPTFGTVVIDKNSTLSINVTLQGATPNSTYDIWVNQDPDGCPLSSPTAPDALTTDDSGNGSVLLPSISLVTTATKFWISAVGGGKVLRSLAVSFD